MSRSRKHAMYVTPGNETREERRAQRRAIDALIREDRLSRKPKRVKTDLPVGAVGVLGDGLGRGGYWNPIEMKVPTHETTSYNLAGIYPFVADSGIGHNGPILGVDLNADALMHFSPWDSYADTSDRGTFSTNILTLGAYRAGKSGTIKTLVVRSMPFGYKCVVPSDPKAEWAKVASQIPGGVVYELGGTSTARMNPLDRGPRRSDANDTEDEQIVSQRRITTLTALAQKALDRNLAAAERSALYFALELAIASSDDNPTIRRVHAQLREIERGQTSAEPLVAQAATEPRLALDRFIVGDLAGLFEDESTVQWTTAASMIVVDTSELFQRSELVAQIASICTTAWIQAMLSDRNSKNKWYLIREEGWNDMTTIESLRNYQAWLKLSRHYGISNIVILHKMGDLDAVGAEGSQERSLAYSIVGDIENKFIFRVNQQEADGLQTRLNLPAVHVNQARALRKGEFLAYIGSYVYIVDCFATSTPFEFELFRTDDAMQNDREMSNALYTDLDDLWPVTVDSGASGWLAS